MSKKRGKVGTGDDCVFYMKKYKLLWCSDRDVGIIKNVEKATARAILEGLEAWHDCYLDEHITDKTTTPSKDGKCVCWTCELGRFTEELKKKWKVLE